MSAEQVSHCGDCTDPDNCLTCCCLAVQTAGHRFWRMLFRRLFT